jgi:hypothetical protein
MTVSLESTDLWDRSGRHLLRFPDLNDWRLIAHIPATPDLRRILWDNCYWDRLGRSTVPPALTVAATNSPKPNLPQHRAAQPNVDVRDFKVAVQNPDTKEWQTLPIRWSVRDAVLHADGRQLIVGGYYHLQKWDALTLEKLSDVIPMPEEQVSAKFFDEDSCFITLNTDDAVGWGFFRVWDTATLLPLSDPISGHDICQDTNKYDELLHSWESGNRGYLLFRAGDEQDTKIKTLAFEFVSSNAAAPDWLPDLLEAVGGMALNQASANVYLKPDERNTILSAIKKRVNPSQTQDCYHRLSRRLLESF